MFNIIDEQMGSNNIFFLPGVLADRPLDLVRCTTCRSLSSTIFHIPQYAPHLDQTRIKRAKEWRKNSFSGDLNLETMEAGKKII